MGEGKSNTAIKTIVFDLGGVYFLNGTKIALKKMYKIIDKPKNVIDPVFRGFFYNQESWLFHRGKLTSKQFWSIAKRKLGMSERLAKQVRQIWYGSYKPTPGMKTLVKKLRRRYYLVVFSGNIKERVAFLDRKYGVFDRFDDFVFSYDFGMNKTEIGFHKVLLKKIRCKPEQCIVIDDFWEALKRARSLGFRTIKFHSAKKLEKKLRSLGVSV